MTNLALIADPTVPEAMSFEVVSEPEPLPSQAVVEVHHAGLNHGDLNDARSGRVPRGAPLGSDFAGVVIRPAADGSGPGVGTPVFGLAAGAWACRIAVGTSALAPIPPGVPLHVAAALPVAGLAALRTVTANGDLRGRKVLVTGASGGVGTFAVQIAANAGAHVVASVGHPRRAEQLKALGAHEVVVALDELDLPVDVVIDNVGGPQLVKAWTLLAAGGRLHSVGWTSGAQAILEPYSTVGPKKHLISYLTEEPYGDDLARLVDLVAAGRVVVSIGWRNSWKAFADAASALRERRVDGKAVLDIKADG